MGDILDLQDDEPETPGEEKQSYVSYVQCPHSAVSVLMCLFI